MTIEQKECAIKAIEKVSGFDDESTIVGEAFQNLKIYIAELEAELAEARDGLLNIVDPVHGMVRNLKKGERLNGYASVLANDAGYLKGIAKECLTAIDKARGANAQPPT